MNTYNNFTEIEKDLRKLQLEKNIAKEELKIVGYEFKEFLKPINWVTTVIQSISKYGLLLIIKRVFK